LGVHPHSVALTALDGETAAAATVVRLDASTVKPVIQLLSLHDGRVLAQTDVPQSPRRVLRLDAERFVTADLNGGEGTVLRGHDDWANLVYSFQNNPLRFGAVYREPDLVEQSPQQAAEEAAKLTYRPAASVQPIPGPVLVREVELDGSSSTVPGGGQIVSYQWRVAGLPAALNQADRPKVTVQFGGGPGEYRFDLTVTAQNGLSHTTRTTVVYAGR
jgi:hypothetical protein